MTEQVTESLLELPNNWSYLNLTDLAADSKNSIKRGPFGSTVKKEYFVPQGYKVYEQKNVIYNNFTLGSYFIDEKKFNELKEFELRSADIVISCSGTIGKVAIAPGDLQEGIINQALLKITLNENLAFPLYFVYLLSSQRFQEQITQTTRGSAMQNIASIQLLKQMLFPIPPFQEQKRIVAKVEELFSRLDSGVEALKKAKEQLKRYRESVLKSAFEGRLTEQWRKENKDKIESASVLLERIKEERRKSEKYEELSPVDTSELLELPEGWVWTRVGEVGEINPPLPHNEVSDDLEVSFLPMKVVEEETGKYDLSLVKKYSKVKKGYTPFINGDVIFAKITPCMENGKIAVLDNLKNGVGFGSTEFHVIRCLGDYISNKYIFFYLLQEAVRTKAVRKMKGTAGQLRVPASYVESLTIPLSPLQEQKKIVEEIEHLFSIADQTEKTIEHSLTYAERLRQSILKRGFEGKLVPQDPTDESASILLERIKAEKAKKENNSKNKSNKKSSVKKRGNKQYTLDNAQTRLA
jgi:type I restriction enzyme S subunit